MMKSNGEMDKAEKEKLIKAGVVEKIKNEYAESQEIKMVNNTKFIEP